MSECSYRPCDKPAEPGRNYCIFHEPGEKDAAEFDRKVREQIGRGDFNFRGYIFPEDISFRKRELIKADFSLATFQGVTSFEEAEFKGVARFGQATFQGVAEFLRAGFHGATDLRFATFQRKANFMDATFQGGVSLDRATFKDKAYFSRAKFPFGAAFDEATFEGEARFTDTRFQDKAIFAQVVFQSRAIFDRMQCDGWLVLDNAIFKEPSDEAVACRLAQVAYRRFGDEDKAAEYYLRKKRAETRAKSWHDLRKWRGLLLDVLSEYGESPARVIAWIAIFISVFALIYKFTGQIYPSSPVQHDFNFRDALYFSIVTFTTLGHGDWFPNPESNWRFLATGEAMLGALMMALLVATAVRRWMR